MSDERPKPASIATRAEMLCFLVGITPEELEELGGVGEDE